MSNTADVDELLRHSAWMKRLAASLTRDRAQAEDLLQDAWLAALAKPPRPGPTVRSWLGQVLRNTRREELRAAGRASQREERVAMEGAPVPSVESLVGTAEIGRILAERLLQLPEPYLSTLLQVFYEGRTPSEIAAQLGIPAGTVRWRLKEGLDQLREQLDRDHQGDRTSWLALLTPVLGPKTLSTTPASTLTGGLAMKIGLATLGAAAMTVAVLSHSTPTQAEPTAIQPTPLAPAASTPTAATPSTHAKRALPAGPPREKLLSQITRALHPTAQSAGAAPSLSPDYIQAQIHELAPLLRECYENALVSQPGLQGKLVVKFTIVGDPSVGGLVGESTIAEADPGLSNPAFQECVQETMYGARFTPPPAGGEVKVTYPFTFTATGSAGSSIH
jgi:RNA polymerase sigma-70 factor (ECF subfamily)